MANRFWVGGTGTWNSSSTTNWSAISGGSSGASAPTSADDVIFNASSGGGTCTTSGEPFCKSLTTTGYTGSLTGALGAGTISLGLSQTHSGLDLRARASILAGISALLNISFGAGTTVGNLRILPNATVNIQLGSSINCSSQFILSNSSVTTGTSFNTQGFAITAPVVQFAIDGVTSGSFSLTLSSSTITASNVFLYNCDSGSGSASHSGNIFAGRFVISHNASGSFSKSSGTLNASSSGQTSSLTGSGISISCGISIGGASPTFTLNTNGFSGTLGCTGNITSNGSYSGSTQLNGTNAKTLTVNSGSSMGTVSASSSFPLSLTGAGTISNLSFSSFNNTLSLLSNFNVTALNVGGSSPGLMTIQGSGGVRTLTSSSFSLSNITWTNITAAGTIPFTGTGFVNGGGNTNIQFSIPGSSLFFGNNF